MPAASKNPSGHDHPILKTLQRLGLPLTRKNFIDLNWAPTPDPWTWEDEEQLPEHLQDWSGFEKDGDELVWKGGPPETPRKARAEGGGFPHATTPHVFHSNLGHAHRLHVGPIHSAVHGRTDHLPIHVPSGSYVLPADVVAHHGQDNTSAGFKVMRRMFGGAPYGKSGGPYDQGSGPYGEALQNQSRGGRAVDGGGDEGVPIVAAGGEYVLSPEQVRAVGKGDPELGAKVLDEFVKETRAQHIKTLQKLPGPAKD